MKKALIIQHMEHDHIGRFAEYFAEDNIMPTTVRPFMGDDIPALAGFDVMFVLGGAQDTWQSAEFPYLAAEKQAIREWVVERAKPYFGICLGHQLLADVLGGTIGKAQRSEVGVFELQVNDRNTLLANLPSHIPVMQWHHAEVQGVPEGAKCLASSDRTTVQALQVGAHAFSTQFHCEFTPQAVLGWAAVPGYVAALNAALGANAHTKFVESCWPHMPAMARHTRTIWDNFKRMTRL
jgi:GMP synthase-like glutamine amidotransferase